MDQQMTDLFETQFSHTVQQQQHRVIMLFLQLHEEMKAVEQMSQREATERKPENAWEHLCLEKPKVDYMNLFLTSKKH